MNFGTPFSPEREIQFDRYQRLSAIARKVRKVIDGSGALILDVGGYPGELPLFLPEHTVIVTDFPANGKTKYVRGDGLHLPFGSHVFDVVTCSDVLEHISPESRKILVEELFRVSKFWVLLGVPRGAPDVREAEEQVDSFYRLLHGEGHPWLVEHFTNKLPSRSQVMDLLESVGARFEIFPNGYLHRWTIGMIINRYLEILENAETRLARFNEIYNTTYTDADSVSPAYRDIYVATRTTRAIPGPDCPGEDPGWNPLWRAFQSSQQDADLSLGPRPSITAIVVTYNHEATIMECLLSLAASQGVEIEIIVVDNDSRDSSAELAFRSGVTVVLTGENLGFAGGFNMGWRLGHGEVVVAVNPDVLVEPDALSELTSVLVEHRNTGVVGAKLLDWSGKNIQHAGGKVLRNFCTSHVGRGESKESRNSPESVDYVCGALMAIRRSTLEKLGGLDEGYSPAYYEETDFCFRVREQGFRVVYWPWACGRHLEGAALGVGTEAFFRAYHKGRFRFVCRHLSLMDFMSFLRAEKKFRRGRASDDPEIVGLRTAWRGWRWKLPTALLAGLLRRVGRAIWRT